MAISATCDCGKTVRAPDHAAGKKARCPACGNVLRIPMPHGSNATPAPRTSQSAAHSTPATRAPTAAAPENPFGDDDFAGPAMEAPPLAPVAAAAPAYSPRAAQASSANSAARPTARAPAQQGAQYKTVGGVTVKARVTEAADAKRDGGGIATLISSIILSKLFLAVFAIAVVGGIGLYVKMGPMKANEQFKVAAEECQFEVTDLLKFVLRVDLAQNHMYDPTNPRSEPKVIDVTILNSDVVATLPDFLAFVAKTSAGPVRGRYFIKTHEIDGEVPLLMGPGKMTGRIKGGNPEAEIGGVRMVMPVIVPRKEEE